jgi:hypothetical protein
MSERRICTKERPYDRDNPEHEGQWAHPDAYEVGEQKNGWPAGDIQGYKCPHCKKYFEVELPQ